MSDRSLLPELSPRELEQIAHNLCSLHDFDPAFVVGQERFARAVIAEWERLPKPAPVRGGEPTGEAVAWRVRGPRGGWMHSDKLPPSWRNAEPLYAQAGGEAPSVVGALRDALKKIASGYAGCDDFDDAQIIATEALTALQSGGLGSRSASPPVPTVDAVVGWIKASERPDTRGDLWLALDPDGRLYLGVFVNHRIPETAALVQRIIFPKATTPAEAGLGRDEAEGGVTHSPEQPRKG